MPELVLNKRARGWLRYLWQKVTTPDDWSEEGEPHPWWDRYSTPPVLNFPRFDLSESSYALGVMADQTPAWRELYALVLEGLVERHLTYWAAIDWLTQIGPDPRRNAYPQAWIDFYIPAHLVGHYDMPGWVANGIEPWGLQPDPIGADGNLFFKGWLNLLMVLHAYVSGEDKWGEPFQVAGVDRTRFEWTQHRLVELLVDQWRRHPEGPHCENTKVWPYCLSAAGLGLQLYDRLFGSETHQIFQAWLQHTRDDYFGLDAEHQLRWVTLYYDPLIKHKQTAGPAGGLGISLYMMPQAPALAELLYHGAVARLGWNNPKKAVVPTPDPRFVALGLALAKEYGDEVTEARLRDHVEQAYEPRFFGTTGDEFGWWFHLEEAWPRGQISALLMMAEVGPPGAWSQLFRQPHLTKYQEPTVEGVEFPLLGICQAVNDPAAGVLNVTTYAADSSRRGQSTRFRITKLPDAGSVSVRCDEMEFNHWRMRAPDTIEIETDVDDHRFEIQTGHIAIGEASRMVKARIPSVPQPGFGQGLVGSSLVQARTLAQSAGHMVMVGPGCPCCFS